MLRATLPPSRPPCLRATERLPRSLGRRTRHPPGFAHRPSGHRSVARSKRERRAPHTTRSWRPGVRPSYSIAVLQVRDVGIEAGGLPLVSGVSFTLSRGDKAGLVGRNGVGKTTLLQVLAGEAEPAAGVILRQGRLGYLRQDPKLRRAEPGILAVSHVLEGRGMAGAVQQLEKLRLEVEEDPSARNVGRYSRAEERYRHEGGYSAEAEAR